MIYAAYQGVFTVQFLLAMVTSRMLAVLSDCLLAREMLRLFFECWASYAAYHGVFIAQFLLFTVTVRMLAMLNDYRRVKCCVCFF